MRLLPRLSEAAAAAGNAMRLTPAPLPHAPPHRGQSFHFAPRNKGESFDASIIRHELRIAEQIKAKPGMTVLDAGCGVGGPMRAIAKGTGVSVVGITINEYQVSLLG